MYQFEYLFSAPYNLTFSIWQIELSFSIRCKQNSILSCCKTLNNGLPKPIGRFGAEQWHMWTVFHQRHHPARWTDHGYPKIWTISLRLFRMRGKVCWVDGSSKPLIICLPLCRSLKTRASSRARSVWAVRSKSRLPKSSGKEFSSQSHSGPNTTSIASINQINKHQKKSHRHYTQICC